jgi:GT2 family glycosyltransferase
MPAEPIPDLDDAPPDEDQADDAVGGVAVAYVFDGQNVSYSWHHSMVELIGWDLAHEARILRGGYIATRCGTDGLVQARNKTVSEFLDQRRTADWLFWIDTDMGFPPDVVDQLLSVADPAERPVVGALTFSQRELTPDGMGGWRTSPAPVLMDWRRVGEQQGHAVRWNYSRNTVTQVAGTGSACILIHRSVLERVRERYGDRWYDRTINPTMGDLVSEDLSFCMRLLALEIPMFVHTGVRTTHAKSCWVAEDDYLATLPPPPATEPTAVVVPVLRRPQNAAPFMASLRASTGLATAYAVVDPGDEETAAAWARAGAVVLDSRIDGRDGTFAEKVNRGYAATDEPWLFLVGDDVRFRPGWLDHAQAAAGERFHVIGTNDLGNPRVLAGEHATHMLIRRSYVDEMGASWDGPGVVAHEGYRHWYVDDEIVAAAKARGVWMPAGRSHVEHVHPLYGKAAPDEVYELGAASSEADRELFEKRRAEYL